MLQSITTDMYTFPAFYILHRLRVPSDPKDGHVMRLDTQIYKFNSKSVLPACIIYLRCEGLWTRTMMTHFDNFNTIFSFITLKLKVKPIQFTMDDVRIKCAKLAPSG